MPYRFWILVTAIFFNFLSNAQEEKISNYLKKIELAQNKLQKEKLFDSLAKTLYRCKCKAKTKHQYIDKAISLTQNNKTLTELHFKARLLKSKLYFREGEFQNAIEETETLKTACQKNNYTKGFIRSSLLQGRIYNRIDQYDLALKNFKSALSAFEKIDRESQKKMQKFLINLYANLARLYMNMHQDSLADVFHIKTVNLAYKIHDYERISFFNNILGWKYFAMGNYKVAERYFLKALQDSAKIKLKVYNISNFHALGVVYDKLNQPQKALHHDSIALNFFIKTNNNTFISSIYNNMAKVFLKIKEYDKALETANKAIEIAKKHEIIDKIITGKLTLSKIFIALEKYDEAFKLLSGLTQSDKVKKKLKPRYKSQYHKLLSDIYVAKNDWKNAFKNLKLHLKYSDSIHYRKLKALSGTETKYQKELLRKRMLLEQQEVIHQKKQKQKLIYSIIFLIALILSGLFLAIKYYKKYLVKQQELKETLQKIDKLNTALFKQNKKYGPDVKKESFRDFIKEKYGIYKIEVLDVWESIANGMSRTEYVTKNKISENTVKAWRKELYKKLKQHTGDDKFSDYKAVIEYYKSLRDFEYFYYNN